MKKIVTVFFSFALFLGLGTAVFAAGNSGSGNGVNFEKMLPFMQKIHPDASTKQLEDMYKSCQKNNEMISGTNKGMDSSNMMN